MRSLRTSLLALSSLLLVACQDEPPPRQAAVETDAVPFKITLNGQAIHLVLTGCEAFLVNAGGKRERMLTTDFYPMFSMCSRQTAEVAEGYVRVELGRTAFGAGGCCATGGVWRSRDGRAWERRREGRWEPYAP